MDIILLFEIFPGQIFSLGMHIALKPSVQLWFALLGLQVSEHMKLSGTKYHGMGVIDAYN